jgi:hypothetical protein
MRQWARERASERVVSREGEGVLAVIASEPTGRANARPMTDSAKQSILSLRGGMDCFAALAMTISPLRPCA